LRRGKRLKLKNHLPPGGTLHRPLNFAKNLAATLLFRLIIAIAAGGLIVYAASAKIDAALPHASRAWAN